MPRQTLWLYSRDLFQCRCRVQDLQAYCYPVASTRHFADKSRTAFPPNSCSEAKMDIQLNITLTLPMGEWLPLFQGAWNLEHHRTSPYRWAHPGHLLPLVLRLNYTFQSRAGIFFWASRCWSTPILPHHWPGQQVELVGPRSLQHLKGPQVLDSWQGQLCLQEFQTPRAVMLSHRQRRAMPTMKWLKQCLDEERL